jgi:para-nitrobenzyl esterase
VSSSKDEKKARRPVLVWIYGGGLQVGESDDYDGSKLAAEGGVVVVTLNYRLGVLGFLAHPSLDKEGHLFANYGLMDQQFALQWVQRNIAAFGGDPQDVTLVGESSGGRSVLSQIVSPAATGLFQHAIVESGAGVLIKYPGFGAASPLGFAEELGTKFAEAAGCRDQSAKCLRDLPIEKILAAQATTRFSSVIVDGTLIPKSFLEAFGSGHFNRVTLVNGSTHDEWRWAVGYKENDAGAPMTASGYPEALAAYYGKPLGAKVLAEYPLGAYLSPSLAYSAAVTDSFFACSARRLNQIVASQMPTYAYEFADQTAPNYLKPTSFEIGAGHTSEIQYLFPLYHGGRGIVHPLNPLQEQLSAKMVAYWTRLREASAENPWPRYDAKQDNYMRLILPEPFMTAGTFSTDHKCAFWDKSGLY